MVLRHRSVAEVSTAQLSRYVRARALIDKFFHLGLSISCDRVLRLSAEMGNSVCQRFHMEKVVCPPTLRGEVFTTAAVDNLDHNPSATIQQKIRCTELQYPCYNILLALVREWIVVLLSSEAILSQGLLLPYHISTLMYHPLPV